MKKIVFISVPAYGHVNPTLAVVKELVKRGIRVLYYATEEFREALERVGAEFRPYKADRLPSLNSGSPALKGVSQGKVVRRVAIGAADIVDNHLEEVKSESPDCLIYDSMALWATAFIKALEVPAVSSVTTFASNSAVMKETFRCSSFKNRLSYMGIMAALLIPNRAMGDAFEKFTLGESRSGRSLMNIKSGLNLVYTSRQLQPHVEAFDLDHIFVGPSITDREESFSLPEDKRRLIYISIGTAVSNPKFFQVAKKAFSDGRYRVVLSVGKGATSSEIGDVPDNFYVSSYLPQLEVLKRASLFISHCGMNSVHESLYNGVPIIGLPQTGEQSLVAGRVEKEGAGIYLRTMTPDRLRRAAERILNEPSYRENCLRLREQFREAGGAARAADEIISYAGLQ